MKTVALITGASSGIGKALALELAKGSNNIVICSRNLNSLLETKDLCTKCGVEVLAMQADVSKEEECQKLIDETRKKFGRLDILINNAGVSMRALFKDTTPEILKVLMDINFWGCVYCTHYALPLLLESKGTVVGISSVAGFKGLPGRSGYSASKFAMDGFLESLRIENLYTGLHVLTVHPGYTSSNIRNTALRADGKPQRESPRDEEKMMSSEECAKHIIRAIKKKKSTLTLTTQGQLLFWLNKFFPSLCDRLVYQSLSREKDSPLKA